LKQFFSKGKKKQMHNKKHFGGCMHKEGVFCYLSLEAILLQGKEETDAQQKHFGRCMHKEWFLICPLKHFFSKGKKKQMHNKSTLEDACIRSSCLSLEALLLQGKEETDAQQKHFGRCMHKECFLICPLKHFFSKGKKKQMHNKSTLEDACIRSVFLFVP
jgi:hypothetical protein